MKRRSVPFYLILAGLLISLVRCGDGISSLREITIGFADYMVSTASRTRGAEQISLRRESGTSSLLDYLNHPIQYREVPRIFQDDEGANVSSSVTRMGSPDKPRPATNCGWDQSSIVSKIADCLDKNKVSASWDGTQYGIGAESHWDLVTRQGAQEIWIDQRTGLLWSGTAATNAAWCAAAGNNESAALTCSTNSTSVCAEVPNFFVPSPVGKGGLSRSSMPAVYWRLPTMNDFKQADIDGIRFTLPIVGVQLWSATIDSSNRSSAWMFSGSDGTFTSNLRSTTYDVICVGRTP